VDPNIITALTSYLPQVAAEGVLAVAACVLFLGGTFVASRRLWGWTALISLAVAGVALAGSASAATTLDAEVVELVRLDQARSVGSAEERAAAAQQFEQRRAHVQAIRYASPLLPSQFALFIKAVALLGGVVLVLLSWDEATDSHAAEYHACLLLMIAGVALTAAANDLITFFLALELVSIPTYVLLYLPRTDEPAQEAAMKYFLLSIFSSGLLLFGFSYLYGLTGTTNLTALGDVLGANPPPATKRVALVALLMVVAALGFRVTAVPFHFYAPDVYQGTATAAAAMLAFMPKLVGFVALVRLIGPTPLGPAALGDQGPVLLWIMAAVTMSLGNVLALLQDNLKRLLAYSSVAHAGYMLLGLASAARQAGGATSPPDGVEALLFYLIAYGAMTMGAFAVLSYLSTRERPIETIDDVAGLARTHPGAALLMALFMFSLIGIPLTAGFAGKLWLFAGALATPGDPDQSRLFVVLAVIMALNAAIGGWYYLRVVTVMYLRDALEPIRKKIAWPVIASILLCAAVTLGAGVYPGPLLQTIKHAVHGPAAAAATEGGRAEVRP
jgi:NADH-quinone oxidoreductase subunit N